MVAMDLARTVPEPLAQWVKEMLRADAPALVFGVILTAIGLSATVLYFFPRKTRDVVVISFGLFTLLYGIGLLAETQTIPMLTDISPTVWAHLTFAVAYVIPVPFLIFFLHTIGHGWHQLALWAFRLQVGLASLAIIVDLVHGVPGKMAFANHILAIFAFLAFLFLLFAPGQPSIPELRSLRIGFVIFAAFGIETSLASLGLVRGPTHLEPIGLFVFVLCLGTVVAHRAFRNQEHLGALREELEIARRIQLAILPGHMPHIEELEVTTRYLPSSAVAGDFYDFLITGDRCLGILIADVSGHGVPAALLASMIKVAISTQAQHAGDPAAVLSGLNRILYGKLQEQFVTASYLFLDVPRRKALYASAGHPALLLWRDKEKRVSEYDETGLVLGVSPDVQYANTEFRVEIEDRIVLCTDGVLEAMNKHDELFGRQRLKQSIKDDAHVSGDRFCDALLGKLGAWTGSGRGQGQADDVTLIVVDFKRTGDSPETPTRV
jgi:sigma-B regulation protein RsbU (phosphoserine phosphatase)